MTAPLVPELYCRDVRQSLEFYTTVLGFRVKYDRPENGFAYIEREGAEMMLDSGKSWLTGSADYPLGRGINFQIEVKDIEKLYQQVRDAGIEPFLDIETTWYRVKGNEMGNRQFIVLDPDGYQLRFFQNIGIKPA